MRIARNLALLALFLAAPLVAQQSPGVQPASTCGDCTCDQGQCCYKNADGGCGCKTCETEIE